MQLDIRERVALRLFGIAKRNTVEIYLAVAHLGKSTARACQRRLLVEHLADTLHRLVRDGQDNIDHREHHQLHHYLKAVVEHSRYLTDVDGSAARREYHARADKQDKYHVEVYA